MKSFESLFEELQRKVSAGDPHSGTVRLVNEGVHAIGKKILEEAGEVWMAAEYESDERAAEEISQLMYHVQVMMLARGLTLDRVYRVDCVTGNATLEIELLGDGDTIPGVNFGENAMAISPDGLTLAIGDVEFDEIHLFSLVPEPGALGLVAIGAASLVYRRRR